MMGTSTELNLNDDNEEYPHQIEIFPNGQIVTYGGDEGSLYIAEEKNTNLATRVIRTYDEAVRAVAVSQDGKRVAIGFENGEVRVYNYPDYNSSVDHPFLHSSAQSENEKDSDTFLSQANDLMEEDDEKENCWLLPQASVPIRDLKFSPSGNTYMLAVATEASLFIVNTATRETLRHRKMETLVEQHHDMSGIRGTSFLSIDNGLVTLMASIAMDGRLCVWNLSDENDIKVYRDQFRCIPRKDVGEANGATASDRARRPLFFCINGQAMLALPGKTTIQLRSVSVTTQGELVVGVDQDNQDEVDGHMEPVVSMEILPSSQFLATGAEDGRVILWQFLQEQGKQGKLQFIKELGKFESVPTSLKWKGNSLLVACANGAHFVVEQKVKNSSEKESTEETATQCSDKAMEAERQSKTPSISSNVEKPFQDNLHDVNDKMSAQVDVEIDSDQRLPSTSTSNIRDDDEEVGDEYSVDFFNPKQATQSSIPLQQAAFQPSSTPLDLPRRFLSWNHIGSVTLFQGNDDDNNGTVNIHFTDAAFRRPISLTDNLGFILGSLGEDGGIFTTDLAEDEDTNDELGEIVEGLSMSEKTKAALKRSQRKRMMKETSKGTGSSIYFHRFATFGNLRDKDWHLTLPHGERIEGCSCGAGWCAVATSRKFLRMFSSGGNQGQILWLPGDVVTMVGRDRFLAVFYHQGTPLPDGTQKIGYILYDATTTAVISNGPASCISRGSSLAWAGFSNDFSLLALDSDGILSTLVARSFSAEHDQIDQGLVWTWSPILDTVELRKSSDDSYWPIEVFDGKLVSVLLKGGKQYPEASRRPITTTIDLRVPLVRNSSAKCTVLEELFVRSNAALTQKKLVNELSSEGMTQEFDTLFLAMSAQVDKVTLKLFATLVENGKLERALDLIYRLHLEKSHDLAIEIADNHRTLQTKIEDVRDKRFSNSIDADDCSQECRSESGDTQSTFEQGSVRALSNSNLSLKGKHSFPIPRGSSQSRNVRSRIKY